MLLVGFIVCCGLLAAVTIPQLFWPPAVPEQGAALRTASPHAPAGSPAGADQPVEAGGDGDGGTSGETPDPPLGAGMSGETPDPPLKAERTETKEGAVHWVERGDDAPDGVARALADVAAYPQSRAALDEALRVLSHADRPAELLALLSSGVRRFPADRHLRSAYAGELMKQRLWVQAIAQLRQALAMAPDDARTWFNLAVCQQAAGQLGVARRSWDRAIALDPQQTDAYAYRGQVLLDLRAWSAALADFERVAVDQPDATDARLNAALALVQLGRFEEALERAAQAVQRAGDDAAVLDHAAHIARDACAISGGRACRLADEYAARAAAIRAGVGPANQGRAREEADHAVRQQQAKAPARETPP